MLQLFVRIFCNMFESICNNRSCHLRPQHLDQYSCQYLEFCGLYACMYSGLAMPIFSLFARIIVSTVLENRSHIPQCSMMSFVSGQSSLQLIR